MFERIAIKLLMNSAVMIPLLYLLTSATVAQIVISSLLFAVIAFIAGDQGVLRKTSNTVAVIADMGLAGLYFWGLGYYYGWGLSTGELAVLVLVVALIESMYHIILRTWDKDKNAFSYDEIE